MGYRKIEIGDREAVRAFDGFLEELSEKLEDSRTDRNELCRKVLADLYFGPLGSQVLASSGASAAARAMVASFDPRNVTLEPEYYEDLDAEKYYPRKPLIWLWIMFDRSPVGQSAHLGHRLRRLLARHIFKKCGENVKIWHMVEFSYGYNLSVGDNVVIHRGVLLDDRGEIVIGSNASISDWANVYSHSHNIHDINDVTLGKTVIGDGVRVTYHATVLSGTELGHDSMVGTVGVVTKSIPPHHVNVGIPAKTIVKKKRDCPHCGKIG